MVRLSRFGVSCIISLGFVSAAQALEGGYVKFSGGVTAPENYSTENEVFVDFGLVSSFAPAELDRDLGVGFMGAAAVGFRPMDRLRLELEAGYGRSEADTTVFTWQSNNPVTSSRPSETDLTLINGMVNGWFDVARFDSVSFFLGAGVGISYVDVNSVPEEPETLCPGFSCPMNLMKRPPSPGRPVAGSRSRLRATGPSAPNIDISIRRGRTLPTRISPPGTTSASSRSPACSARAPSAIPMAIIADVSR